MKESLSKIFLTAIRIVIISFLVTFLFMSLAQCTIEQTDETVTVLSYSANNDNFDYHFNSIIPVKVIATNSKTDISADIVYFPTDTIYEEYKDNFKELKSIRICNVACLYVPEDLYSKYDWNFNNIIKVIEEDKIIDGTWHNPDVSIRLDIDLGSKEAPAFLELLFNYFSGGISYNELSNEDRIEIISKMKDFITKNESLDKGETIVFSINDNKPDGNYVKVSLDISSVISERLLAITEHGEKYIEDIKEEYFMENGMSNCKIISSLPSSVIKEFSAGSFDYEINTVYDEENSVGFYLLGILLALTSFFLVFVALETGDEFFWLAGCFLAVFIHIVSILVSKSYEAAIVITIGWFIIEIFLNEFYGLGPAFEELKKDNENKKAKALERELKEKEFSEQFGEGNLGTFNRVIGKVDDMINFCKELEVNDSVWMEIKSFIQDKPKSISIMKNIIDENVNFMLMIYSSLSDIKEDEEKMLEVKELLVGVNEAVSDDFEDKKKLFYGEINACIKHIKANLQGRIKQ